MRRRTAMVILIFLTICGSIIAQLEAGNVRYRVHQHKEETASESSDALSCITKTEVSGFQYDPDVVDISKLESHLPLIVLETSEVIPGELYYREGYENSIPTMASDGNSYVVGTMKVYDNDKELNRISQIPDLIESVKLHVRGNSSRWFDKQSYSVKVIDSAGENKNIGLLGMEKNHDWVLHGPFLDKTLIRNYMAMNIAGELMDYAPDVRFCEVVRNGEYQGLYVMMETVSRGKGRIDIEKPNTLRNVTGYIFELNNDSEMFPVTAMDNFTKYVSILRKSAFFDIVYPGKTQLTPELKDYIERDVSSFEKALYSYDYDSYQYGFPRYADVDEFVDYYILMEVFLQHDTGNRSTYFYKDVNGLFKPCVWDFNNDLENISQINDDDFGVRKFVMVQAPWFLMMSKEETFIQQVIDRYRELRKGILSDEYLKQYIQDTIDFLGNAVDRNYAVWGYSFDVNNVDIRNKLHPDERNPENFEEALDQMEEVLFGRLAWMDENIEALKQYSHESAVKKYNP